MNTSKTINLPMDVAREIAKYNDQTQEIEKLTAELAKEKTTIEKLKAELEKAKIYKEAVFTMRESFFDTIKCCHAGICDVCSIITYPDDLTYCDADGCGGLDTLCVCENCREDHMTFDEEVENFLCNDCNLGTKLIPRIDRFLDKMRFGERIKSLEE